MASTFKINGDTIDLIKLLKVTGLCDTGGMAQAVTGVGGREGGASQALQDPAGAGNHL